MSDLSVFGSLIALQPGYGPAGTPSPNAVTVQGISGGVAIGVSQSGSWTMAISGTAAVTQSGTWTTGRTWNLSSGSDTVTIVPSGTQTITGSVSVSNFPATQPVSGTVAVSSLPSLPAGGNVIGAVTQSGSWNMTITGTVAATQFGSWNVGQTGTWNVGLNAGSNIVGKFGIDQTTPGTTNGVQVNAALPAGTNLLGKVGIDQTTPGTTNGVQINAALPAGSNTIGGVTQSSGPWSQNVTQFGGTNISTGTGAGGVGIPRVTVSNDSTVGLVSGTQVKIVDTGGSTQATVKAASTLPAATDTAIVTTLRDTSTVQNLGKISSTGSITALGQTLTLALTDGYTDVSYVMNSGTGSGTQMAFYWSFDGGSTYAFPATGLVEGLGGIASTASALLNPGRLRFSVPTGATHIQAQCSSFTNNATVTLWSSPRTPVNVVTGASLLAGTARAGYTAVPGIWWDDTSSALGANATFTSTGRDLTATATATAFASASSYARSFNVQVYQNVTFTLNLQASRDNTNWFTVQAITATSVASNYAASVSVTPAWRYYRYQVVNGAGAAATTIGGSIALG